MIAIIDYGASNIHSITHSLTHVNAEFVVTNDIDTIQLASKVIVPGQGAFLHAMTSLTNLNLIDTITDTINSGKPFLGICLGFQVLFESSDEHDFTKGLGIFPGHFTKFSSKQLKVPHMGWNSCELSSNCTMFNSITPNSHFYFVHSYYLESTTPSIISATTQYGSSFVSAIQHNNVWGTQFHPEKSSSIGLKLLENFCSL